MTRRRSHRCRPSADALKVRRLPSTVYVDAEPNDAPTTASRIDFPADGRIRLRGSLGHADDRDFFAFVAPASGRLTARLQKVGGDIAPVLIIRTATGRRLLALTGRGARTSGEMRLVPGNRYILRLEGVRAGAVSYVVNLATSSPPPSPPTAPTGTLTETEPNDSTATANRVRLDRLGVAVLVGRVAGPAEADFFTFDATATGSASIVVRYPAGGLSVPLRVMNRDGVVLVEAPPIDSGVAARFGVVSGATYFVRIGGNQGVTPYRVEITQSLPVSSPATGLEPVGTVAEREGNDTATASSGFVLDLGGQGSLRGIVSGLDDQDYFRFTATTTGRIVLVASTSAVGSPPPEVAIHDETGQSLTETRPLDVVNSAQFVVQSGRRYVIRVRAPSTSGAIPYRMDLALT